MKSLAATYSRSAGVLLHITSLPSDFGIGDIGPEAYAFVDFLKKNSQRYWQLLPIGITEASQSYSPYSAASCMAGNILLISPEFLVKEKLLTNKALSRFRTRNTGKVDFIKAEKIRDELFEIAYEKFLTSKSSSLHTSYKKFKADEFDWLNDFALYRVIKESHGNLPWYEWPLPFKNKDSFTLRKFSAQHGKKIDKERWLQFIFFKQWRSLKLYCNNKGIKMFGDLPFYISYDSVDVWSHPEIFNLTKEGKMRGVAGVPPDYFNADGQLWGMPVFKWDVLKKNNYDWWIRRIKKNLNLYDLLRFDHFRAFSSYWEVPGEEKTAIHGKWKKGPGPIFFNVLQKQVGAMPFVAEDLGEIDQPVYSLRDEFKLPGMKVLQFAFEDPSTSDHIPHHYKENFIAYTGTHDNNTTKGWYRQDCKKETKNNLDKYIGKNISDQNVSIELIRLVYASVAKIVIIPMQDLLSLDEKSRMNKPASTKNNWAWRFKKADLKKIELNELTRLFGREM